MHALLNRYLDAGGNYVETAAQYGDGESELKMAGVVAARRDEFVLTTKCHPRDREAAAQTIDLSLRQLQTDHVDILLMHHVQTRPIWTRILAEDGALRAAEDARRAGKVRFIGISNHGHPEMMIQALERYPLDVIMTGTNYYDRFNFPRLEAQLLPMAVERGVGIVGMKGVGDGYLWRSAEMALRYAWSLPIGTLALGWNTLELLEQDLAWAEAFTPLNGRGARAACSPTRPSWETTSAGCATSACPARRGSTSRACSSWRGSTTGRCGTASCGTRPTSRCATGCVSGSSTTTSAHAAAYACRGGQGRRLHKLRRLRAALPVRAAHRAQAAPHARQADRPAGAVLGTQRRPDGSLETRQVCSDDLSASELT